MRPIECSSPRKPLMKGEVLVRKERKKPLKPSLQFVMKTGERTPSFVLNKFVLKIPTACEDREHFMN